MPGTCTSKNSKCVCISMVITVLFCEIIIIIHYLQFFVCFVFIAFALHNINKGGGGRCHWNHCVTAKCQRMFVQMIFLNHWIFCDQTWYDGADHHEPDCLSKRLVSCLQGQGQSEGWNLLSNISSELLNLFQLNLVWWLIILNGIVSWKDQIALLLSRSRPQEKFKISMNVHPDDDLLNCWTFCNQIWDEPWCYTWSPPDCGNSDSQFTLC